MKCFHDFPTEANQMKESNYRNDDDAVLFESFRGGVRVSVVTAAMFSSAAVALFSIYFRTLPDELKLTSLVWFVLAMFVPGLATSFHRLAMRCYRLCPASCGIAKSV